MIKNDQFKNQRKSNRNDIKERDNTMPRQKEFPKINTVAVVYNGDRKTFDTFIESMINDYLNSDSMPKSDDCVVVDKAEIVEESA